MRRRQLGGGGKRGGRAAGRWQWRRPYLLTGVLMVGVPLMALAVSCVVITMWQDQRFRRAHGVTRGDSTTSRIRGARGVR